jgi:hypothetical protein
MTTVFVVRPFGKKPLTLKDKDGCEECFDVDFDAVDRSLIQPALKMNGLTGETTGAIARAGNIRVDMFQMLIGYDLVIADISIDNANVFYELGVRHGLRPRGTILIRFRTPGKEVPFDLRTDRYVEYDRASPEKAVDDLAQSIKQTLQTMRLAASVDSPVFQLLPDLDPPNPAKLFAVPPDFRLAVETAEADMTIGVTTLALLAEEARRTPWGREGLRLVGRAQRRRKAFEAARETWTALLRELPGDIEANLMLATIQHRLGNLVAASQACRNVLDNKTARSKDRADARSQLARNEKAAWVADFKTLPVDAARRQAISDHRLIDAYDGYMGGFAEDLNDYYSGLNALGLLSALVQLAELLPNEWVGQFPSARRAEVALEVYKEQVTQLRGTVRLSLDNARERMRRSTNTDADVLGGGEWLPVSEAQYQLLTSDKPQYVRTVYKAAKVALGQKFSVQSESDQVAIFHRLDLFPDNCREALEALGVSPEDLAASAQPRKAGRRGRIIVATGHRVDAPNRPKPRFPNTPENVSRAREWLKQAVKAEIDSAEGGTVSGIGGAASGCDLLFHEVCAELGIKTKVCLAVPRADYVRHSVADGGPEWVEKFNRLIDRNPPIVLSDGDTLPPWAEGIAGYGVFQRGNIWMMEDALLSPDADVTLLALWNGEAGDGPGGTADMVQLAKSHGAKVCIKDTRELFGLGG